MTLELLWAVFTGGFLIASAVSWYYLYGIYKNDPEPAGSWLLEMLHERAFIDVVAISILAFSFFRSTILDLPPEWWTRAGSGLSILALATGPIHKAVVIAHERRKRGK